MGPHLLLELCRTLTQKAKPRGAGLKLQALRGSLMAMLLAGQLMASGYWGLRSNSCLVPFDQHSVLVLIPSLGWQGTHGLSMKALLYLLRP